MVVSERKTFDFKQFVFLILLLAAVFLGLKIFGDVKSDVMFRFKCIYLFAVDVLYIILWIRKTHRVNSLFFYFILYFMVTNGGTLFLNGIDWSTEVGSFAIYSYPLDIMNKALDYQLASTAILVSSGILFYGEQTIADKYNRQFRLIADGSFRKIKTVDWMFIIISIIYISICLRGVAMRSVMGYGEYYYSDNKVSAGLMVKYSFYVSMYYSLFTHISNKDFFRNVILAIDLILTILLLTLGSRNEIIPMVFGIIYVFGRAGYKLSRRQTVMSIVYAILFLLLLGVVPLLRGFSVSSLDSSTVSDVFSNFGGLFSFLVEMGGSLRTTTETMAVANGSGFHTEPTILYTLLFGIIPSQSILNLLGFYQPENWSLATWVTDMNGGGSGWGYSMLAESYYNFKEFGVLWFVVWAFLYSRIEIFIDRFLGKGKLVVAAAWLYVGSYAIFLARADTCLIAIALRYTVYITFLALLLPTNKRIIKNINFNNTK